MASEAEIIEAALQQFYVDQPAPPDIHVPVLPDDVESLEAWLSVLAGRKVRVVVPQRGEKRGLLDLAMRNAALAYDTRFNAGGIAHYDALDLLRRTLGLASVPQRIDCFDISTIQGAETVASMVVCEQGRMRRGEYRKFRIHARAADGGPDDFAAMEEVVQRRYSRVADDDGPWPDLIVIDGGYGQLSAAYAALERLGLSHLVAVGLAKKEELIVTRDHPEPIALPTDSPALLLLQRIRDEAHRFAVTFHRKARSMRDLQSELDGIPGIGPRRRKQLLTRFGSVAGVRRAAREDLEAAVGPKAAAALVQWFDSART